ncbi:MAG: lysophospholipid acyltransferase family protein [Thermodesulfobacteriota bacterium]
MTLHALIVLIAAALITPLAIVTAVVWSFLDRSGNGPNLVARTWARLLVWTSLVRVQVIGREKIDINGTYVFAANHTSVFDILVLQAYLPIRFRWLAKEELFRIPFFGLAMTKCGYIPVNRSNPRAGVRSLERAAAQIRAGASVVIFPEGTRSADGTVQEFKRGGFTLAVKSGRPVVPVSISGAHRVLKTKTLKLKPGPIKIVLSRPLPTEGLDRPGQEKLAQEVRRIIMANQDPDYGLENRRPGGKPG